MKAKAKERRRLTLAEAQAVAADLLEQKVRRTPTAILKWAPWLVRAAELWIDLTHYRDNPPAFEAFVAERRNMRHCSVCGCSDDDACDGGCEWACPDLCSNCVEAN